MRLTRHVAVLALAPLGAFAVPGAAFADSVTVTSEQPAVAKVDSIVNSPSAAVEKSAAVPVGTIDTVKAKAVTDIAKRQASLIDWQGDLAKAKADCGQNGAATARIAQTQAALTTLGASIAGATDLTVAKTLYQQIFTHNRVYLIVGPAVHIPIACGNQLDRANRLAARLATQNTNIASANARGANTAAAAATLGQIQPLLDQAKTIAAQASISVTALAPDLGNDVTRNANAATIKAARDQIRTADGLLDSAARILRGSETELRQADKVARKSAREAEKAARKAAKEAEKALRKS